MWCLDGVCKKMKWRADEWSLHNESVKGTTTTTTPKSPVKEAGAVRDLRRQVERAMPLPVTEDTPPDMLAGAMDIRVLLPNGRTVNMSVERSTPMMDLLVAVSTAHKLSPAAHALSAVGERGATLHHLPSTPVGALDTRLIHLTARNNATLKRAPQRPAPQQPFLTTFRLQVHLPRNQLFVTRVSPETKLADVLKLACAEKNLDPKKYEMRHPANLQEKLSLSHTLGDYRLQEVTMVASRPPGAPLTPADIMALHREEGVRRQQVKATGNTAYPSAFAKRASVHQSTGSVSSDSLNGRSISPAPSDESRSVSPPAPEPPKRPGRKRRPAPKPPGPAVNAAPDTQAAPKDDVTAFHSRTSSDSSGYHEASVLSESTDARTNGDSSSAGDTLPRRSKLPASTAAAASAKGKASTLQHGVTGVGVAPSLSRSLSNLAAPPSQNSVPAPGLASQHSASTTSLASQGGGQRKKKAAPPPPSAPARRPVQLQPSVHVIAEINEAQSTPSRIAVEPEAPREPPQPTTVPVKAAPVVVQPVTVPVKEVATEMPIRVTTRESPTPVHVPVQATRKGPPTVVDINVEPAVERNLSPPTIVAIHREEEKTPTPPPTVVAVRRVVEATVHKDAGVATPRYLDSLYAASAPASLAVDPVAPAAPAVRLVARPPNAADIALTPPPLQPRPTPRARAIATPTPSSRAPPLVVPRARRRDDALPRVVSMEMKRDSLKAIDVDLSSDTDSCSLRSFDSIETTPTPTPMATSRTEPEVRRGVVVESSATSLTSLDEVPAFLRRREDGVDGGVGLTRWDNVEELHDRPTFLLGDPDTEEAATWGGASTSPLADDLALSGELSGDWEYTLPAPPTAFRDLSSPSITEFGTVVLADAQVFLDADADADAEVVEPEPEPVKIETPRVQIPVTKSLDVVKATPKATPKKTSQAPPEDSWEPQQLATPTETTPTVIGDLRTRPDGLSREVYKVNPLFEASRRPPPGVATLGKYAPDERELLERSKTLVSRSAGADVQASTLLKNFTISSYAMTKPTLADGAVADVTFRKPAVPADKPLLRTNSAAGDVATRGVAVKRATSYLSLARPYARPTPFASIVRAQSISSLVLAEEAAAAGALRKAASEVDVREDVQRVAPPPEPLQSVQVLRSILGQSQTAIDAAGREADERHENVGDRLADKSLPPCSEHQPETTPTPASPTSVSASPAPTPAPTTEAPTSTYVYRGPPAINFGSWSERPKVQVSLKSDKDYRIGGSTPALRRFVEDKVLRRAEPRVEAKPEPRKPKPLTMRIVSQSYKPSSEPAPARPSSHSVDGDVVDAAVVSRLPIVRAVELKKPATVATTTAPEHFVQLRNTSSTLLNGDAVNGKLMQRHSVDVASLQNGAAKRYTSVVGVNGGVAAFGGGKPMPTVKGFRTGEVVQPLKTINGAEHNVRSTSNWAQRGATGVGKAASPLAEPATVVKFKKPVQRPLEKQFTNPRDALMDAIKNFGGQDALKLKNESSG